MKVKFCPRCGNSDLVMIAGANIGIFECKKCKFRGAIFPEGETGKIKLKARKK